MSAHHQSPQRRSRPLPATIDPVQQSLSDAASRCAGQGARLTSRRAQVLECLLRRGGKAKAYDLLADIQAVERSIAPMTVYRALDFLVEQGLVHKGATNATFVVCQHEGHHAMHETLFLVCERCGSTTEWHDADLGQRLGNALASSGFHSHEVEIKGECASCTDPSVRA